MHSRFSDPLKRRSAQARGARGLLGIVVWRRSPPLCSAKPSERCSAQAGARCLLGVVVWRRRFSRRGKLTTPAAPGFPRRAGRRVDALLSNRRLPFWKLVAAPAAPSGLLARLPCPPSSPFTSELPDIHPISPGRRRGGAFLSTKSAPGPPRPSFPICLLGILPDTPPSRLLPPTSGCFSTCPFFMSTRDCPGRW